jgi:hypothetical protein
MQDRVMSMSKFKSVCLWQTLFTNQSILSDPLYRLGLDILILFSILAAPVIFLKISFILLSSKNYEHFHFHNFPVNKTHGTGSQAENRKEIDILHLQFYYTDNVRQQC